MHQQKKRRLAAIMFTDIVGYTAIMQQDEQRAAALRSRHREVFERYHQEYHGEIIQYFGDGSLSLFQSGVEAVHCAIAIQLALQQPPVVPLRIGLHLSDIVYDGTEIYGDGVNLASRIEGMGIAGAVLLSDKLNEELHNQEGVLTHSLGAFELKNISRPVKVFAVANEGIKVPRQAELQGKQQPHRKSIAVLPFVNRSTEEENEYFCDGMTEEIINALTKIESLKVTSRTSSFHFKNTDQSIREIGEALKVSAILEGSIRLSGNRMRITAQLIDVEEDFHFWSASFNRSIEDIFAVQDEISLLIADRLREHLGHFDIAEQLVEAPNISVDVYQRYLKGRYNLLKMSREGIKKGMAIMEQVIREQANYPLAHLGMHMAYTLKGTMGMMSAVEAFSKAQPHLDKAIELDAELPECQLNSSWISFLQNWDFEAAYQHLSKLREARPMVDYYQTMTTILTAEGKFAAAHHYIDTALEMDPFSHVNYHLKGFTLHLEERYEEAIDWFTKSTELQPGFQAPKLFVGHALLLLGRAEACQAHFASLPDEANYQILKLGGLALADIALGRISQAETALHQLEVILQREDFGYALDLLIQCQTLLQRHEAALQWIERAIELHHPIVVYFYNDPILKSLRPLPRFRELMQQVLGKTSSYPAIKRKYKQSLFDEALLKQYREQLTQLMQEQQPYLDSSLTLRRLAQQMDLSPNQLSQLLNEGFHKNFAEFVNTYRLEAFKAKVADPTLRHLTLLALAYESGFNSKTVFNTFFKKMMGKTPKAYWKEIVKQ